MVQIRERDLPARNAFVAANTLSTASRDTDVKILVNDRADIAVAAATGVHLTTRSLSVGTVRAAFGADLLIGASTHTPEEVSAAEQGGADFVVFGPVFETPSKREYGNPVGIDALRRVAISAKIPVLALGGISLCNFREALDAGAAGVAGISMFTEAQDLSSLVATIKSGR